MGNLKKWVGGIAPFVTTWLAMGFNDNGCTVFVWLDMFPFFLLIAAHVSLLLPFQRGAHMCFKFVLYGVLLVAYIAAEACVIFNEKLHDYTCTSASGQPPVVVTNKTMVRVALFFVVLLIGLSSRNFRAWLVWCQQQGKLAPGTVCGLGTASLYILLNPILSTLQQKCAASPRRFFSWVSTACARQWKSTQSILQTRS